MAEFSVEGMDDLIKAMQKADLFDEKTQADLLDVGTRHLMDAIQEEAGRSSYQLKRISNKLSRSRVVKVDKLGDYYKMVTVSGKNERGERNATVAFVLNYGRQEEYGKIEGSYYWTRAVRRADGSLIPVYKKIISKKLQERGLV